MPDFFDTLLQNIVEGVPVRIFWKDQHSKFLGCNTLFAQDAGFSRPEDLIGKTDFDLCWMSEAERYRADDQRVMATGVGRQRFIETRITPRNKPVWLRSFKKPWLGENHEILGVLCIYEDITEFKLAEINQKRLSRALTLLSRCNATLVRAQHEQELLDAICRLIVEVGDYRMAWIGFAEHGVDKPVCLVAKAGIEAGYLETLRITWGDTPQGQGPAGTAISTGKTVVNQDFMNNSLVDIWRDEAIKRGYRSSIAVPLVSGDKRLGALTMYSADVDAFNPDEVSLLEELASDLAYGIDTLRTRIKSNLAEERLEFLAYYDSLTGLPNRLLLRDRFDQAKSTALRGRFRIALLLIDLDNFKQVNDTLGHDCGDQLLLRVTERLRDNFRKTDTISRQSGDEFIILMGDVQEISMVGTIVQQLLTVFLEPLEAKGHQLNITASIGISIYPDDGEDIGTLIKHAEVALYQAKDDGRNGCKFFNGQMNANTLEHLRLQGQLREALRRSEFRMHYQPQMNILTGKIVGAEALVRWQHPELGLISPGKFIPLAERSGLIIPLGEWVLHEACRQAQSWRELYQLSEFVVAINLSAVQFKRDNIVETVTHALARSSLPPNQLELELTETILLQDMETAMTILNNLREIGVKCSIDDFGTGYSSLSYLKQLAVDKLKIDQSFVHDMVDDPDNAAIVKAIIQLSHALQLTVIAEGVESEAQLTLLKELLCDEIQGYWLSHPLPPEEFMKFYKAMISQNLFSV